MGAGPPAEARPHPTDEADPPQAARSLRRNEGRASRAACSAAAPRPRINRQARNDAARLRFKPLDRARTVSGSFKDFVRAASYSEKHRGSASREDAPTRPLPLASFPYARCFLLSKLGSETAVSPCSPCYQGVTGELRLEMCECGSPLGEGFPRPVSSGSLDSASRKLKFPVGLEESRR